jgi:hypothetical protein
VGAYFIPADTSVFVTCGHWLVSRANAYLHFTLTDLCIQTMGLQRNIGLPFGAGNGRRIIGNEHTFVSYMH